MRDVRFDYYRRLSAAQRRIYDKSDAIGAVTLPRLAEHQERTRRLDEALARGARADVEAAAQSLASGIARCLGAPNVAVRVLSRRPKNHAGELHGLYTLETDGRAQIEVWMRTAEHGERVAFRTFLRTLLHEVCHHLDLTHFALEETFHTKGFFRRESSLTRQLDAAPRPRAAAPARAAKPRAKPAKRRPEQLSLFS